MELQDAEIKPQYATHSLARNRFVLEAEITGGLEHPSIVPVHGLGAYDDGRPFHVMRFIKAKGLPLRPTGEFRPTLADGVTGGELDGIDFVAWLGVPKLVIPETGVCWE